MPFRRRSGEVGSLQQQQQSEYWAQDSIPVRIARQKLKCACHLRLTTACLQGMQQSCTVSQQS